MKKQFWISTLARLTFAGKDDFIFCQRSLEEKNDDPRRQDRPAGSRPRAIAVPALATLEVVASCLHSDARKTNKPVWREKKGERGAQGAAKEGAQISLRALSARMAPK